MHLPALACMWSLATLGACSGDADPVAAPPATVTSNRGSRAPASTTATAPPTDPPATEPVGTTTTAVPGDERFTPEEREVIVAYRAAIDAIWEAGQPPMSNPDHPALAATMVDPALTTARRAAAANLTEGVVFGRPPNSRFEVRAEQIQVDGSRASITECTLDDGFTVRAATGEVLDDRVGRSRAHAELIVRDGVWKLLVRDLLDQQFGADVSCD